MTDQAHVRLILAVCLPSRVRVATLARHYAGVLDTPGGPAPRARGRDRLEGGRDREVCA